MIRLVFPPGFPHEFEVRVSPTAVEFWRWGGKVLELAPEMYRLMHGSIEERLQSFELDTTFQPYKPEELENAFTGWTKEVSPPDDNKRPLGLPKRPFSDTGKG